MSKSSDPRHFFETDAAQEKRGRRQAKSSNKYGNPIKLKSKLLASIADPRSPSAVFVAEAAGSVRRVDMDTEDTKQAYLGPSAPVTCVAIGGPGQKTLFAGSWDKDIWSWDITSREPGRKYVGHSDFVKAVVCVQISGKDCLISGGADKKIIVWDIATYTKLHVLQDTAVSMLAVQDLAVDPVKSTTDEVCLFSASSDPHIRRWQIRLDSWKQVVDTIPDTPGVECRTIVEHETTIYRLVFEHEGDEVDLWTASADGTAKCLSRLKGFTSEDKYSHGDHVRAVAVTEIWVITAGRDEDIKFWDRSTGRLYCALEGHYDEVTDLVVLRGTAGHGSRLCSVSIDGTVRSWSLAKADIDALVQEQKEAAIGKPENEVEEPAAEGLMTADEEAELAALMEED